MSEPFVEVVLAVAVEVHQQAADSSDISFNLEITGTRPAVAPDPDTDGDGMRDAWEIAHGFAYWNSADGQLFTDPTPPPGAGFYRVRLGP